MAAPVLINVLGHLVRAVGVFAAAQTAAGVYSAGQLVRRPDVAWRATQRQVAKTFGFGPGVDESTRNERWGMVRDTTEHLRQLVPEIEAATTVFGEVTQAARDTKDHGLLGLMTGLVRVTRAADRTSIAMIEMQSILGEYSAAHALAIAELQVGRIQRSIELGSTTGTSFRRLSRARGQFEEAMLPFRRAGVLLSNEVVSRLTQLVTAGVNIIERIEPVTEIIEWFLGDKGTPDEGTAEIFLNQLQEGFEAPPRRRPRRV